MRMCLLKIRSAGLLLAVVLMMSTVDAQKVTVVRPVEINDVLINPGMGLTTFQMFNGDNLAFHDVLNEADINTFGKPGVQTNNNHPLTSIAYFRIQWRLIEPEQGKYRWDFIDALLNI